MRLTGSGNTARMSDPKRQERNDAKATSQENTQYAGGYGEYTEDEIWDNIVRYEAEQKQKAGTAPGAVAGAMAGAAGASVAKKAASANQQVQPSPAGNMRWGSMTDTTRGNPKTASPVNPLLTGKGATDAAVADQINQNTKTLTQMYLENKNNPQVEEYYQILKAQEAEGSGGNDEDLDEALGEAMYKSYAKYSPDGATKAARQAQENAYDAARRAAGGAGTSYAATAGAKAYSDTYESYKDQEADREMEAFEKALTAYDGTNGETIREWLNIQGLGQQSVQRIMNAITGDYEKAQTGREEDEKQALLSDFMGTMLMAYDGTNEASLRQLAAYEGITDEDFDLMLAAVQKDRETSTESSLSDEAKSIYAYLTGKDEYGNPNYTGEYRNMKKQDLLNLGYSEEAINEALDMYDNRESEYYKDVSGKLIEALTSGMTDKVYEKVGCSAEEWAGMDEEDRAAAIVETMANMVKQGQMDSEEFASVYEDVVSESVDAVMEKYEDPNWFQSQTGIALNNLFTGVADIVLEVERYRDSGVLSENEYVFLLKKIASESRVAGLNDNKGMFINGTEVPINGTNTLIYWAWTEEKKEALQTLYKVTQNSGG